MTFDTPEFIAELDLLEGRRFIYADHIPRDALLDEMVLEETEDWQVTFEPKSIIIHCRNGDAEYEFVTRIGYYHQMRLVSWMPKEELWQ